MNRVRCVPDGAYRKVQIGTQHSNGLFDWYDLTGDDITLTDHGLLTSAAAAIQRRRSQSVPIGVHVRDLAPTPASSPAAPVATPDTVPDRAALAEALRQALVNGASVTPLQHSLDSLEAATRQGGYF
ncbi:hypothetical protein [Streptomyces sp. C1-2]|uniref:hypothetical protein n=1 Tax=Streptomyces sp. C1-2 TaxID=2720022 RepID=UPI0014323864|nr:hypothetical protein [Streptomyces sp. C1-2]NJP72316.1 hypothetical protein [Streptomyces sp. C1-2]